MLNIILFCLKTYTFPELNNLYFLYEQRGLLELISRPMALHLPVLYMNFAQI
jgi:hypothetical protein